MQGRVFDPTGDQHTTSEAEAYALFFALAGNDRARFDLVLAWTQANLAQGDLQTRLPAWLWGKDKDGVWKTLDPNPASDADAWMAYTLIEAGRLWKTPRYSSLGQRMLAQIEKTEVVDLPGFGPMMAPGPVGFQHDHSFILNPSYLPLFLFDVLLPMTPRVRGDRSQPTSPHAAAEFPPRLCHGLGGVFSRRWVLPGR